MWILAGLGNPGSKYDATRHNIGFVVIDELMHRHGADAPRDKFGALVATGSIGQEKVLFCKPQKYMNLSGEPLARIMTFWKVPLKQVLVVHDELDLPAGKIKLGTGGGHGGHNGLKSIFTNCGGKDFPRIRCGIGRPTNGQDPASYVLARFPSQYLNEINEMVDLAADAAETIMKNDLTAAMNAFNGAKNGSTRKGNPREA